MANLIRFDPFQEMQELQKQFFGDDWFGTPTQLKGRSALPTTDVYTEGDERMIVEAHLPNFAEDDVDVSVDKGYLVIRAEQHESEEDKEKDKRYVVRESSSSFYRRVALPDQANEEGISADIESGVLKVEIPFKEKPQPKKIAVGKKKKK